MKKIKLSSILFILYFMKVSNCNIFICFLSLTISRISTLFVYIQIIISFTIFFVENGRVMVEVTLDVWDSFIESHNSKKDNNLISEEIHLRSDFLLCDEYC